MTDWSGCYWVGRWPEGCLSDSSGARHTPWGRRCSHLLWRKNVGALTSCLWTCLHKHNKRWSAQCSIDLPLCLTGRPAPGHWLGDMGLDTDLLSSVFLICTSSRSKGAHLVSSVGELWGVSFRVYMNGSYLLLLFLTVGWGHLGQLCICTSTSKYFFALVSHS